MRRFGFCTVMLERQKTQPPSLLFSPTYRNTTILCVRKGDQLVLMGDRQVTLGQQVVAKSSAVKLRRIGEEKDVVCGFAGSTADAITLLDKLESKLKEYPEVVRAAVELAKEWRSDKVLRHLEASLIVADRTQSLEIDGRGNILTPEEDGILSIGSGGIYAKAAARALIDIESLNARDVAQKAMKIATDLDIYSNSKYDEYVLTGPSNKPKEESLGSAEVGQAAVKSSVESER